MRTKKFIQAAHLKHGALHKQLGYGKSEHIPTKTLERIVDTPVGNKVYAGHKMRENTALLKRRANMALNLRRFKK